MRKAVADAVKDRAGSVHLCPHVIHSLGSLAPNPGSGSGGVNFGPVPEVQHALPQTE